MRRAARRSAGHRKTPDALARVVGARIRALRGTRDISFDAFVEESGLGRGYVSELERGLVVPNIRVLERVAAVLDVTMADLVLGDTVREQLFAATSNLGDAAVTRLLLAAERGSGES